MSAIAWRPSSKARSLCPRAAVYHGEDAERWPIVRLRLHDLLLLRASRFKSRARTSLVFGHPRQQTFANAAAQTDGAFVPARVVAQGDERSLRCSRIAFGQRAIKPDVRRAGN